MSPRVSGLALRRPADALSGRLLLDAMICVFLVSAGWGLFMHSLWVGATSAALGLLPFWRAGHEHEQFEARFRFSLLVGALAAALQLDHAVWYS